MSEKRTFADYKTDAANWITLATGEYYPDILQDACELYKPVLVTFGRLLKTSESFSTAVLANQRNRADLDANPTVPRLQEICQPRDIG